MKKVYYFVRWKWTNWELWQKLFVISLAVQAVSWFIPNPWGFALNMVGFSVPLFYMLKWFAWEPAVKSWKNFNDEQTRVVKYLKEDGQS